VTDVTLFRGTTHAVALATTSSTTSPITLDVSKLPTARVERAIRLVGGEDEHAGACVSLSSSLYVEGLEEVLFEKASYLVTTVLPVGELAPIRRPETTQGAFAERRFASRAGSAHHVLTFDGERVVVCSAVCRGACSDGGLQITGESAAAPAPSWLASAAERGLEHRSATGAALTIAFFLLSAWLVARRPGAVDPPAPETAGD
jgi:hypothetical protein